jgi:hypothetical protein
MKHIIIGDTHGKDYWKSLGDLEYDKLIFLGDYFDSFTIPGIIQLHSFNEIIEFKRQNPDRVVLLFGNHDYHYFPGVREDYSGYQGAMRYEFQSALETAYNDQLLNVVYQYQDYIICHAGLTKTWFNSNNLDINNIADSVNELFKSKPNKFSFHMGGNLSNTGDDITQGPFWVRPQSLYRDSLDNYKFVVGHTSVEEIKIFKEKIFLVDCLDYSRQYLEITEDSYKIVDFI